MDLMEYKARELFLKYEIPVMKGIVADNTSDLVSDIIGLSFPLVVKAQVQVGGRGKAGGIKFTDNSNELLDASKSILGMNIKGYIVKKLLIVEKAEADKECYLSIILDRLTKCPMIIFSTQGGIDIEEVARLHPDKVLKVPIDPMIGIKEYTIRYLLDKSGLDKMLFDRLLNTVKKLYKMFCEYDCMLAEINPLAISGSNIIALDGKVSVDDSALMRQPEILAFRDSIQEDELVLEARRFRFLYIPCDVDGSIAVMSNGSGMIMSCMDLVSKQGMKVGAALDLGGGATSDRIAEAVRILLSNKNIKALFISIFGGITRCDEVAGGVKIAMQSQPSEKIVIIRIEGTNKEKGLEILKEAKGHIIPVDSIKEGVEELAARRELV